MTKLLESRGLKKMGKRRKGKTLHSNSLRPSEETSQQLAHGLFGFLMNTFNDHVDGLKHQLMVEVRHLNKVKCVNLMSTMSFHPPEYLRSPPPPKICNSGWKFCLKCVSQPACLLFPQKLFRIEICKTSRSRRHRLASLTSCEQRYSFSSSMIFFTYNDER